MKKLFDEVEKDKENIRRWGVDMKRKPCFAETDLKNCLSLTKKSCYECKFYKRYEEVDEVTKRLLKI